MSSLAAVFGQSYDKHPLKDAFLKWQCHTRQFMMRTAEGRPTDAVMPAVVLRGSTDPMGHIITILNKAPGFSLTPELLHMARKTNDPAQIRDTALKFLSSTYFQKHQEFSDILTATFPAGSQGAETIRDCGQVTLIFEAYAQRFDLDCKVLTMGKHNPLHEATFAHNRLFNQNMPDDTEILGFEPDWNKCTSDPVIGGPR